MSFNEFLRDHYKAALGAVRSHTWPCLRLHTSGAAMCLWNTARRRVTTIGSLRSRAPLLPRIHARPYYIPEAFSQIESYGLELTNGADTCHDVNARWKIISQYWAVRRDAAPSRVMNRVESSRLVSSRLVSSRLASPTRSVLSLLNSNKTVGVLRGEK